MKYPKKYHSYNGWTLDIDRTGAVFFEKGDYAVYCTTDWEIDGVISIEITNYKTNKTDADEIEIEGRITPEKWFAAVKPLLDAIDGTSNERQA